MSKHQVSWTLAACAFFGAAGVIVENANSTSPQDEISLNGGYEQFINARRDFIHEAMSFNPATRKGAHSCFYVRHEDFLGDSTCRGEYILFAEQGRKPQTFGPLPVEIDSMAMYGRVTANCDGTTPKEAFAKASRELDGISQKINQAIRAARWTTSVGLFSKKGACQMAATWEQ